jgi:eukaryotic-like serine/threonine-protein kinase
LPVSTPTVTPMTPAYQARTTPQPGRFQAPTVTAFPGPTQEPSLTPLPTGTSLPSLTPMSITTAAPNNTQALILEQWTSRIRASDGMTMLSVPTGPFTMGSSYDSNEGPVQTITLDAYWIDKTEITNAMYAKCVNSGKCQIPASTSSATRKNYFTDAKHADYPVIYVSWRLAKTYCEWAGARLPTPAEWEKAARGTDARLYPWGNEFDKTRANLGGTDTVAVGSYESGKSPYGLYDMSRNVWEWVADWLDYSYYRNSPVNNPQGPSTGTLHIIRGASWGNLKNYTRLSSLQAYLPTYSDDYTGFRCVSSTP